MLSVSVNHQMPLKDLEGGEVICKTSASNKIVMQILDNDDFSLSVLKQFV